MQEVWRPVAHADALWHAQPLELPHFKVRNVEILELMLRQRMERLVDQGVLRHPRNKGGSLSRRDRHYAPVLVPVTSRELEQGIQAHFTAPRQLVDWAIRGQLHSTALNEYN